jgi:choline kinase
MKAVIVAAGTGSRLKPQTNEAPKCLLRIGDNVMLDMIIDNLIKGGATSIIIVTGWKEEAIHSHIALNPPSVPVCFAHNYQWELGNGLSVMAAKPLLTDEPFLMAMSDHLVSPSAISKLVQSNSAVPSWLTPIPKCLDIDDATKVLYEPFENSLKSSEKGRKIDIGKEIKLYNAIDCGVFLLNWEFFSAMRESLSEGEDSISSGIKSIIAIGNMTAIIHKESSFWLDVDTPEALSEAQRRTGLK